MQTARELGNTYHFWDALIRYYAAWLVPANHRERAASVLRERETVEEALSAMEKGFATFSRIAPEADAGIQVLTALREGRGALARGDVFSMLMEHWCSLGSQIREAEDQEGADLDDCDGNSPPGRQP